MNARPRRRFATFVRPEPVTLAELWTIARIQSSHPGERTDFEGHALWAVLVYPIPTKHHRGYDRTRKALPGVPSAVPEVLTGTMAQAIDAAVREMRRQCEDKEIRLVPNPSIYNVKLL